MISNIPEEFRLRAQLSVLKDVAEEYRGRTIDNIITNIEARLSFYERAGHEK